MNHYISLLFALLVGVQAVPAYADGDISDPFPGDDGWTLRKSGDGIEVYTRSVEGWAIDEVRAVAMIDAPAAELAALLGDPTRRPQWDEMCRDGKLITGPDGNQYHHLLYDMPWPVTDRDMVLQVASADEGGVYSITGRAAAGMLPVDPDLVRIEQAHVSYLLTPVGADRTRFETTALLDPNGPIPAWLLNQLSVSQPYTLVSALRRITAAE